MEPFDFVMQLQIVMGNMVEEINRVAKAMEQNLGGEITTELNLKSVVDKKLAEDLAKAQAEVKKLQDELRSTIGVGQALQETIDDIGDLLGGDLGKNQLNEFLKEDFRTAEEVKQKIREINAEIVNPAAVGNSGLAKVAEDLLAKITRLRNDQKGGNALGLD